MEWYIEQMFKELPVWVGIVIVIFLGILFIIWLLLPLWVLFIHWNTSRIKDEIQNLVDLLEEKEMGGKKEGFSPPKE